MTTTRDAIEESYLVLATVGGKNLLARRDVLTPFHTAVGTDLCRDTFTRNRLRVFELRRSLARQCSLQRFRNRRVRIRIASSARTDFRTVGNEATQKTGRPSRTLFRAGETGAGPRNRQNAPWEFIL